MKKQTTPNAARTLLSAAELAERYGVSPRTVAKWAQSGRIVKIKVGMRVIRYDVAQADAAVLDQSK